jgi:hypothetical protein
MAPEDRGLLVSGARVVSIVKAGVLMVFVVAVLAMAGGQEQQPNSAPMICMGFLGC